MSEVCQAAQDESLPQAERDRYLWALVLIEYFNAVTADPNRELQQLAALRSWAPAQGLGGTTAGAPRAQEARGLRKLLVGRRCSAKAYLADPSYNVEEIVARLSALESQRVSLSAAELLAVEALVDEALGLDAAHGGGRSPALRVFRAVCEEALTPHVPETCGVVPIGQLLEAARALNRTPAAQADAGALPPRAPLTVTQALREAAKNLTLLADHLSCDAKFCTDCLCKHALLAEAFVIQALGGKLPGDAAPALVALWPSLRALRFLVETTPDRLRTPEARTLTEALGSFLLEIHGWLASQPPVSLR